MPNNDPQSVNMAWECVMRGMQYNGQLTAVSISHMCQV